MRVSTDVTLAAFLEAYLGNIRGSWGSIRIIGVVSLEDCPPIPYSF
jgi:hypothetical protein